MTTGDKKPLKILFLADVVGRTGRQACEALTRRLREEHGADFTIVNVENVAQGSGVTAEDAQAILKAGADVLTSGNHIWRRNRIGQFMKKSDRLLRPANHNPRVPGRGMIVMETESGVPVGVLNLQGRVFMEDVEHPFDTADRCIEDLASRTKIIIVDFHAEATSEKVAMGHHLNGRVSAVIGTHTHVQTADERILPWGTAYITDAGMTGPFRSVIGVEPSLSLRRFLTGMPQRFEPAEGPVTVEGVVIAVDSRTGKASSIKRLRRFYDPVKRCEVKRPD